MKFELRECLLAFALVLLGGAIGFWYARLGYMPIDQSIVFDGGWRILSGQVPYRDFDATHSVAPALIQAGFFALFGVNWFAYCLHAAVFNGLFCAIVYAILRLLDGQRAVAFAYALLSSVVYYPPSGLPLSDQHAFFFSAMALVLAVAATRATSDRAAAGLWGAVPAAMALAYLSKQNPSVLMVPVLVGILVVMGRGQWRVAAAALGVGTLAVAGGFLAIAAVSGMDLHRFYLFAWKLASETGGERMEWVSSPVLLRRKLGHVLLAWNLTSVYALHLVMVAAAAAAVARRVSSPASVAAYLGVALVFALASGSGEGAAGVGSISQLGGVPAQLGHIFNTFGLVDWVLLLGLALLLLMLLSARALEVRLGRAAVEKLLLAEGLFLVCLVFASLTSNHPGGGIAFGFLCLGLVHLAALEVFRSAGAVRLGRRVALPPAAAIGAILLLLAANDAWRFDARINRTRIMHEGVVLEPAGKGAGCGPVPRNLRPMVWGMPEHYTFTPCNFQGVLDFFAARAGNFFLIGDASILYGLTGRPSVNPALWFHKGQALPKEDTPEYPEFQRELRRNLRRYDVRYVVQEGIRTWDGTDLSDFDLGVEFCGEHHRGPFWIREICRG